MPPIPLIDAAEIDNSEMLWRAISPEHVHTNESTGQVTVSEGAFRTQEMSVYRASLIDPQRVLNEFPGFSIAAFSAGAVRSLGCIVALDPADSCHAVVCRRDDPAKRITGSQATYMRNNLTWARLVVSPPAS